MKIAILGTRGIPNHYGGFEQFAEYLSCGLLKRGHEVAVYCPLDHPYKGLDYQGVKLIKKYFPEKQVGASANYIYDFLCLRDALSREFDILLECGYTSVPFFYYVCRVSGKKVITHMDGMEWRRAKWGFFAKHIIKWSEEIAVKKSPFLVVDNENIRSYYQMKYDLDLACIPYGAEIFKEPDEKVIGKYDVSPNSYFLTIGRIEKENNFEMILDGYLASGTKEKFLVIGNPSTKYSRYLQKKYTGTNIAFIGNLYKQSELNNLRYFSKLYFHGHSVGGTNPSLLEAMASQCLICLHENVFNRSVAGNDAFYFSQSNDIVRHLQQYDILFGKKQEYISNNLKKITTHYAWDDIITLYENFFNKIIQDVV